MVTSSGQTIAHGRHTPDNVATFGMRFARRRAGRIALYNEEAIG